MKIRIVPQVRALAKELASPKRQGDPDSAVQASRVLAFSLSMLVWVPVYAAIYAALDAPICSNIILSGGAILLGIVLLLRRGVSPETCGNMLTGAAWYVYTALSCLTGGLWSPAIVWFATLPILSVLLSGARAGRFWTVVSALTITWFGWARNNRVELPLEIDGRAFGLLQFTGLVGLMFCVYLLVSVLKRMEFGARHALREANVKLELQATTDGLDRDS